MSEKERITIAIEPELLARFDALVERSESNRSELLRDLIRERLIEEEWTSTGKRDVVGTLTLLYDHTQRELSERMLGLGHDHHRIVLASMHVHLDHDMCLEVITLRGAPSVLRAFANRLTGLKGVKNGKLVLGSLAL